MDTECIFCKIINREISADIVYEDESIMAFKDVSPVAPYHALFIPKKHISSLNDLNLEDSSVVGKIYLKIKETAQSENIAEDGYRVVANCNRAAGQLVFHIHFHLLGGRDFSWPPG